MISGARGQVFGGKGVGHLQGSALDAGLRSHLPVEGRRRLRTRTTTGGLRERKKAQTRRSLQEQAMRLFLAKGYDTTTVAEIVAAAGVSHMTFFRYFPTKEDVVLADDYDPLIADLIAARPANEAPMEKLRHALATAVARVYGADRDTLLARTRLILSTPALRARLWENQAATVGLIARALSSMRGDPDFRTRVIAAAGVAALSTAVCHMGGESWRPGTP